MTDRERTVAAAIEALVGAVMVFGGLLLVGQRGVVQIVAIGLLGMGAIGVLHGVALGLGLITIDEDRSDR